MAKGICRIRVLFRPTPVAIESDPDMAWGLREVEILDDPPLVERVEQRLNLATNTSQQFSARR